jgi:hypothetical protein
MLGLLAVMEKLLQLRVCLPRPLIFSIVTIFLAPVIQLWLVTCQLFHMYLSVLYLFIFFLLRVAFHQGNLLASLYVPYYNLVYNICHILQKRLLTLTFFSQGGEKGQSFFSYKRYM